MIRNENTLRSFKLFFLQPLQPGGVVCSSFVWRNFLLKYEHRIKDKELHDKE